MATCELVFLGTGTAFHTDGRGSQCVLVRPARGRPFLVDIGPTALAAAARYGVGLGEVERVFVTHLHGDHTAGWPFLLLEQRFLHARRAPLAAHGPAGLRATLDGLSRLCYGAVLDPAALGFELAVHELPVAPAERLVAGRLAFDVLPMDHDPSSLGYRFELGGTALGVSGDTRFCPNLERLAGSCDVLLVECTTLAVEPHAHVSLAELRERRARLRAGRVVLVHLPDAVAASLARDPLPGVIAAHDGLVLEI